MSAAVNMSPANVVPHETNVSEELAYELETSSRGGGTLGEAEGVDGRWLWGGACAPKLGTGGRFGTPSLHIPAPTKGWFLGWEALNTESGVFINHPFLVVLVQNMQTHDTSHISLRIFFWRKGTNSSS